MQKLDIKKSAGMGVLSLGLVVGLAGFAGATSGTIGTTGPDSHNYVSDKVDYDVEVENENDIELTNKSEQYASSGEVEVEHNTTGGDAMSGDAANANDVSAEVEVDNSGAAAVVEGAGVTASNSGSITNTGPDSHNTVKFESETDIEVKNENDIEIRNYSEQKAKSGDAEVHGNTTGGSATSGSVSNTSSASFTVRVTN